jgi:hypothetical protein
VTGFVSFPSQWKVVIAILTHVRFARVSFADPCCIAVVYGIN